MWKNNMIKGEKEKKVLKPRIYDDETLEKMKRYYKIDDNEELLRFIKTHGLKNYNFDINNSWNMSIGL